MLYLIAFPLFDIVYKNVFIYILAFNVEKDFIVSWKKKPKVILINFYGSVSFVNAGCYYDVVLLYCAVMERHNVFFRYTILFRIKRKDTENSWVEHKGNLVYP
jgi:hypothetical protein